MIISLFGKEHNVSIRYTAKNIYFNRINSFEEEYKKLQEENIPGLYNIFQVSEKIAVEYDVLFKIESCIWKIPFVIILQKIYAKENLNIKYIYRKGRARLQRLDGIKVNNKTLYPYLIHTLLLMDRSRCNYCLPEEFEKKIDANTFWFSNDIKYNSNKGCLYSVSQSFYETKESNSTNIILPPEEQISFEGFLKAIASYRRTKGYYYLNIFPNGFYDSFKQKFIDTNGRIIEPWHTYLEFDKTIEGNLGTFNTNGASTKGDKLFQGTYEQCLNFLTDNNNISKIKSAIFDSNDISLNSEDSLDYYNSRDAEIDSFDAMTDGQLGDYDDFIERGGNMDDVDTWARG